MSSSRRSPLAMAVLALVGEAPMHAYRMQQLIKERHKDEVVNVAQRNSVYQTIDRLLRDGLLKIRETAREENRPERTVYELTDSGRDTLLQWMRTMLSTPSREFPEFPAALAFLPVLGPSDAREALEQRLVALEAKLSALETNLREGSKFLPRLFQIEDEYQREVLKAELAYVRGLVSDLRDEEITWPKGLVP
ncbi:PadR family transcriptional regulator [Allorhizocola rhizosphaerae]|uniref:PadR family transcriptional regulator n=1 Tax=Allorhizocola rhizosphaerae TaxID=1872709 RepID=UPI0013C2D2BC|nr:PadR family transcriptional regulator [Allorhizocola rhizosphaerae]